MLPKKVSKDINQLFDFILDPKQHFGEKFTRRWNLFFDKVIFETPRIYNPGRAPCVFTLRGKPTSPGLLEKLKTMSRCPKTITSVHETRDFVVQTIQKNVSYAAD